MSSTAEEMRPRSSVEIDIVGIRELFNDLVAREGKPLSQLAPETGVPYGTLHAWSTAKYQGNNERIARQISAYMTTRAARERARATMRAAPPFVMTKTASRIWEVLEFAQSMPDMVLISADAGVGKTWATEAFAAGGSNVWKMTAEPALATVSGLLDQLARTLRIDWQFRAMSMSHSIQARLKGTKGLLIVDEAQFLTQIQREQLRSTVHDGAGIGVALVGNEELRAQFSRERMTGKNAQLFSRIGVRFARAKPLKEDVAMLLNAWGLQDEKAREMATGIAMKPGANRVMTKVLVLAFSMADARGEDAPTLDDVETAWQQLGGNA